MSFSSGNNVLCERPPEGRCCAINATNYLLLLAYIRKCMKEKSMPRCYHQKCIRLFQTQDLAPL